MPGNPVFFGTSASATAWPPHETRRNSRVSYGLFNLAHRNGHHAPRSVAPGEKFAVGVRLGDIGHRFLPGHRIRLAVSTAYWPTAWPSPATVTLAVAFDRCSLRLPLLSSAATSNRPVAFGPGEGSPPEPRTPLIAGVVRRSLERDYLTGRETLTVVNDDGLQRVDAHGLEIGARAEERYSILPDDPLSAEIEARWMMRLGRNAWQVRTETFARMTATTENFIITARLEAYEGEALVAERSWEAMLPRDHV